MDGAIVVQREFCDCLLYTVVLSDPQAGANGCCHPQLAQHTSTAIVNPAPSLVVAAEASNIQHQSTVLLPWVISRPGNGVRCLIVATCSSRLRLRGPFPSQPPFVRHVLSPGLRIQPLHVQGVTALDAVPGPNSQGVYDLTTVGYCGFLNCRFKGAKNWLDSG